MATMRVVLGGWLRGLSDRVVASDPGLARFRMATTTVVTLAVSLGVLYGVTQLAGHPFEGRSTLSFDAGVSP